ncbi:MAG: Rieske (2Fe-2S) protein [Gammaproteobacteria bacterium]|nr:MAG: Rieske (2Fe-2S) protein [Gammaproteobacteria bacterium]
MSFYPLESVDRLKEGYLRRVKVAGRDLLLVHSGGITRLIENRCPHDGSPLKRGRVASGCIRCPKHGITFSLTSGEPMGGEAVAEVGPLVSFELKQQDGQLGINIDDN